MRATAMVLTTSISSSGTPPGQGRTFDLDEEI